MTTGQPNMDAVQGHQPNLNEDGQSALKILNLTLEGRGVSAEAKKAVVQSFLSRITPAMSKDDIFQVLDYILRYNGGFQHKPFED